MEYCIVTIDRGSYYDATKDLEKKVSSLCKDGWKPQGGVSICSYRVGYSNYYTMSQAMIKYDKPPKPEERNELFFERTNLI